VNFRNLTLACSSALFAIALIEITSLATKELLEAKIQSSQKTDNHDSIAEKVRSDRSDSKFSAKSQKQFRLSRPEPYKNSIYFDWFINEEWSDEHPECISHITHSGNGFNLNQTDTKDCKGYTIVNGWRLTTDQPKKATKNIYLYGGSTVQNHEVPNSYTIASYLQRLLNSTEETYRVHNRGFTTVVTSQQLEFLRKERLKQGDIVVFYDGGNNQWQSVAYNNSKGTIIGTNRSLVFSKALKNSVSKLQSYKLFELLRKSNSDSSSSTSCKHITKAELESRANKGFDTYLEDLIKAESIARKNKADFIHFLQPQLFSVKKELRTQYENRLANTSLSSVIPPCAEDYLSMGASIFHKRYPELSNAGVKSQDLSRLFAKSNAKRPEGEHYLDWIHITEKGNEAVAVAIYSKLQEEALLKSDVKKSFNIR